MTLRIEEQKNKFGLCTECNSPRSSFNWCSSCDCARLVKNFKNWKSGNNKLDEFIQYTQSTAKSYLSYLEWIPYKRFENIKKIGFGSLSVVYSATWKDGERIVNYWDDENDHKRSGPIPVVLKSHKNVMIAMKILSRHHRCTNNDARHFIRHYGATRDPSTDNYVIVMQYANDGSLKDFLLKNKVKHDWQWKLNIFRYLAQDLSTIHNAGLAHCDVKDENVYIRDNWAYLGQLYWSIPKEGLTEKEFNMRKFIDMRGFGKVMAQIATESLNEKINFRKDEKNGDIPKPVLKLIKSCLYDDIEKRPDIVKVLCILEKWCGSPRHHQFDDFF